MSLALFIAGALFFIIGIVFIVKFLSIGAKQNSWKMEAAAEWEKSDKSKSQAEYTLEYMKAKPSIMGTLGKMMLFFCLAIGSCTTGMVQGI